MKDIKLTTFLKDNIEDEYVMNVFYNSIKKSLIEKDFSLYGFSYFYIDGRFLGDAIRVNTTGNYRTPIHSLSLLLSIRLLMVNPKCIKLCEDDNLIFKSKPRETFQWINYLFFIMDNWDDKEIQMIYQMMEDYYYDEEFSDEQKEEFKKSIIIPEYRNERQYYQLLAQRTTGVSGNIIGNNAFVDAKIETYKVSSDIAYVGNTAFAYCEGLESIEFEGKTMFGAFPIIECLKLKQIIVPTALIDYYKDALPYYKNIITDGSFPAEDILEVEEENTENDELEDSEIEHVYIDIPSAAPYTEVELPIKDNNKTEAQEEKEPIDFKKLYNVFEKKATSYKYFWFMAIVSLAKENEQLYISFDDITIRMASMAWPIVFDNDIDLGKSDLMKKYLEDIIKKTKLISAASGNVVETYLQQHYSSQGIDKILAPLLKNVPYRFLSPWVKYTTDNEVIEKSCSKNFNGLYAIQSNHIILDEEWWEYIESNYSEICDYALRSFIEYAKKYNNDMKLLKLKTAGWQMPLK